MPEVSLKLVNPDLAIRTLVQTIVNWLFEGRTVFLLQQLESAAMRFFAPVP